VTDVTGQQIVDAARKYIGCPYVFGGDPNSNPFRSDCSGLVQRALTDCGYEFPGTGVRQTTFTLIDQGAQVQSWEIGDLLFTEFVNGQPNHVVIYSGNGNIIEDPTTGQSVQERNLYFIPGAIRRLWTPSILPQGVTVTQEQFMLWMAQFFTPGALPGVAHSGEGYGRIIQALEDALQRTGLTK
jgi:hypothetical protein